MKVVILSLISGLASVFRRNIIDSILWYYLILHYSCDEPRTENGVIFNPNCLWIAFNKRRLTNILHHFHRHGHPQVPVSFNFCQFSFPRFTVHGFFLCPSWVHCIFHSVTISFNILSTSNSLLISILLI